MVVASDADLVKFHEGLTLVAKRDTRGYSIGYGHDGASPGQTCTLDEAEALFQADIASARQAAMLDFGKSCFSALAPPRAAVLVDMAFECGAAGLAGFETFLRLMRNEDWPGAASDLMNHTLLARQVPGRVAANARIIVTGQWPASTPAMAGVAGP